MHGPEGTPAHIASPDPFCNEEGVHLKLQLWISIGGIMCSHRLNVVGPKLASLAARPDSWAVVAVEYEDLLIPYDWLDLGK